MKKEYYNVVAALGFAVILSVPSLAIVGLVMMVVGLQKAGVVNWIEELKKEE